MALTLAQNANTNINITNTTSGTSSEVSLLLTSSNGQAVIGKYSATKTTYKTLVANDAYIYNGTSGDISILNDFASGNIKFAAGGSSTAQMLLNASGNLGLGTSTPTGIGRIFNIYNSASNDVQIRLQGNISGQTSTDGGLISLASDSSMFIYNYENAPIIFGTNNATVARFTQLGNLNIGTFSSDSGEKLQVTGTAKITGATTFSSTISATQYTAQSDTAYYRVRRAAGTDVGYITDSTTWGTTGTDFSIGASSANLRFFTNNSVTERMRLDASGNLGLAVTPSAWASGWRALEITNSGYIAAANSTFLEIGQNNFYDGAFKYKTTNAATLYEQITGSHRWYNAPSGTANATITFTQAMTLDASGNLLVGSATSSGERLQVTGTAKITGATSIRGNFEVYNYAAGLSAGDLTVDVTNRFVYVGRLSSNSGDNTTFVVRDRTNVARATIPAGGSSDIVFKNNTSNFIVQNYGATQNFFVVANDGAATFSGNLTVDTNTLFVDATNNRVGVGTASPQATFVVSNGGAQGIEMGYSGTYTANYIESYNRNTNAPTDLVYFLSGTARHRFYGGGSERMSLEANGNLIVDTNTLFVDAVNDRVGIGTATPAHKLSVTQTTNNLYCASLVTSVSSGTSYGLRIQAGTNSSDTSLAIFNQAGSSYLTVRGDGNIGVGTALVGANGTSTISVGSGTAPSANVSDAFQMYSADIASGNAAPHFRTENGAVIKLYQQDNGVAAANFVAGIGTNVTTLDAFDGYTIGQVVKALRNAGILS
jgi:hypothetical protein